MSKDLNWLIDMMKTELDAKLYTEDDYTKLAEEIIDSLKRFAEALH